MRTVSVALSAGSVAGLQVESALLLNDSGMPSDNAQPELKNEGEPPVRTLKGKELIAAGRLAGYGPKKRGFFSRVFFGNGAAGSAASVKDTQHQDIESAEGSESGQSAKVHNPVVESADMSDDDYNMSDLDLWSEAMKALGDIPNQENESAEISDENYMEKYMMDLWPDARGDVLDQDNMTEESANGEVAAVMDDLLENVIEDNGGDAQGQDNTGNASAHGQEETAISKDDVQMVTAFTSCEEIIAKRALKDCRGDVQYAIHRILNGDYAEMTAEPRAMIFGQSENNTQATPEPTGRLQRLANMFRWRRPTSPDRHAAFAKTTMVRAPKQPAKLKNPNQACYIHAVAQALAWCPPVWNYCTSEEGWQQGVKDEFDAVCHVAKFTQEPNVSKNVHEPRWTKQKGFETDFGGILQRQERRDGGEEDETTFTYGEKGSSYDVFQYMIGKWNSGQNSYFNYVFDGKFATEGIYSDQDSEGNYARRAVWNLAPPDGAGEFKVSDHLDEIIEYPRILAVFPRSEVGEVRTLKLEENIKTENGIKYKLVSFVEYAEGMHYSARIRGANGKWWLANDAGVKLKPLATSNPSPQMLFYIRQNMKYSVADELVHSAQERTSWASRMFQTVTRRVSKLKSSFIREVERLTKLVQESDRVQQKKAALEKMRVLRNSVIQAKDIFGPRDQAEIEKQEFSLFKMLLDDIEAQVSGGQNTNQNIVLKTKLENMLIPDDRRLIDETLRSVNVRAKQEVGRLAELVEKRKLGNRFVTNQEALNDANTKFEDLPKLFDFIEELTNMPDQPQKNEEYVQQALVVAEKKFAEEWAGLQDKLAAAATKINDLVTDDRTLKLTNASADELEKVIVNEKWMVISETSNVLIPGLVSKDVEFQGRDVARNIGGTQGLAGMAVAVETPEGSEPTIRVYVVKQAEDQNEHTTPYDTKFAIDKLMFELDKSQSTVDRLVWDTFLAQGAQESWSRVREKKWTEVEEVVKTFPYSKVTDLERFVQILHKNGQFLESASIGRVRTLEKGLYGMAIKLLQLKVDVLKKETQGRKWHDKPLISSVNNIMRTIQERKQHGEEAEKRDPKFQSSRKELLQAERDILELDHEVSKTPSDQKPYLDHHNWMIHSQIKFLENIVSYLEPQEQFDDVHIGTAALANEKVKAFMTEFSDNNTLIALTEKVPVILARASEIPAREQELSNDQAAISSDKRSVTATDQSVPSNKTRFEAQLAHTNHHLNLEGRSLSQRSLSKLRLTSGRRNQSAPALLQQQSDEEDAIGAAVIDDGEIKSDSKSEKATPVVTMNNLADETRLEIERSQRKQKLFGEIQSHRITKKKKALQNQKKELEKRQRELKEKMGKEGKNKRKKMYKEKNEMRDITAAIGRIEQELQNMSV